MNKLEQFIEKLKVTNPEFKHKYNATEDFAIVIDRMGNRALVTAKFNRLIFTGVGKTKAYRALFDSYRSVVSELDSSLIYKQVKLFDSGKRYDHSRQDVAFGQRFYQTEKVDEFIEEVDDESYIREMDNSMKDKLFFGRWQLDRNLPHHRHRIELLSKDRITIDKTMSKEDMLFMWGILNLRLFKNYNLVEELELFLNQMDEDRVEQLRALKKDWKLDDEF